MKAPPPVQVSLHADPAWRFAAALLGAAAGACGGAGTWAWLAAAPSPAALPLVCALGGALIGLRGAAQACGRLGWDGRAWQLSLGRIAEPRPGRARLMVDLGAWMLLRFDRDAPGGRAWLALSRRGREPAWHALRCALLYSAPTSGASAPDPSPQ